MLKKSLKVMGFIFTVIMPIVFFGGVVPYTHDNISSGLSTMGYIALALIALALCLKIRQAILKRPESVLRGFILLLFPVSLWAFVKIGVQKIVELTYSISAYWDKVLIFIVLGGVFYIAAEAIGEDK